jgi:hypothetical protein
MPSKPKRTPQLPKARIDPTRRGIVRWEGEDEFAGALVGIKASDVVRVWNSHDDLVEAAKECTKDGECYCPDDFKTHEPCGYCKLIAAIKKATGAI